MEAVCAARRAKTGQIFKPGSTKIRGLTPCNIWKAGQGGFGRREGTFGYAITVSRGGGGGANALVGAEKISQNLLQPLPGRRAGPQRAASAGLGMLISRRASARPNGRRAPHISNLYPRRRDCNIFTTATLSILFGRSYWATCAPRLHSRRHSPGFLPLHPDACPIGPDGGGSALPVACAVSFSVPTVNYLSELDTGAHTPPPRFLVHCAYNPTSSFSPKSVHSLRL